PEDESWDRYRPSRVSSERFSEAGRVGLDLRRKLNATRGPIEEGKRTQFAEGPPDGPLGKFPVDELREFLHSEDHPARRRAALRALFMRGEPNAKCKKTDSPRSSGFADVRKLPDRDDCVTTINVCSHLASRGRTRSVRAELRDKKTP